MTVLTREIAEALIAEQGLDVVIPDVYTSIDWSAFEGKDLTSVVIPDSVTKIGSYAFAYNRLTSVVIPDGVKTIGDVAFAGNQLVSVVIPDGVTTIGDIAFAFNQLTSIVIPDDAEVEPAAFDQEVVIIGRPMGRPIDIQLTSQSFNEGLPLIQSLLHWHRVTLMRMIPTLIHSCQVMAMSTIVPSPLKVIN